MAHEIATAWQREWYLRFQPDLNRVAILVLMVGNWPALEPHAKAIAARVEARQPRGYT